MLSIISSITISPNLNSKIIKVSQIHICVDYTIQKKNYLNVSSSFTFRLVRYLDELIYSVSLHLGKSPVCCFATNLIPVLFLFCRYNLSNPGPAPKCFGSAFKL